MGSKQLMGPCYTKQGYRLLLQSTASTVQMLMLAMCCVDDTTKCRPNAVEEDHSRDLYSHDAVCVM